MEEIGSVKKTLVPGHGFSEACKPTGSWGQIKLRAREVLSRRRATFAREVSLFLERTPDGPRLDSSEPHSCGVKASGRVDRGPRTGLINQLPPTSRR
jgi:hypothetical protein